MAKPTFHIQESALLELGFKKETLYDKNSPKDTFNTLRFDEFKRNLTPEIGIHITYGYETQDGIQFLLIESTCELVIEDVQAPISTKSIESLIALSSIIQGK